jgi:hypothetical protein
MMAADHERLSRTAVEFFGGKSAVGDMRAMYLAIPKNQADPSMDTDMLMLIETLGDDTKQIRHDNRSFNPLEAWSTRTQKSAFIPMCDTPMAAFLVGRSLSTSTRHGSQSIAIDFQVVGLLMSPCVIIEAVKNGTMTRGGSHPCPHWQLYSDLVMGPAETPRKCGTSSKPMCVPTRIDCIPTENFIRIRRNCSLVLQPGPRCMGDLPGVVAKDSGGMLPSGSTGLTLVFAIESTQVGLIQQMTDTHHMLMNRCSIEGNGQLVCNNNAVSAVLNCITNARPRNVLKKTLSEVAATPPKKRAQMDSVAEEQYVFDDMAFLVFLVRLSSSTVAHLFKVGALNRYDGDLYRCEFDIDTNGKFVLGDPPQACMKYLSGHSADIQMLEYTLATSVKHRRVEVGGDTDTVISQSSIELTKQVVLPAEE